MSSAASSTTTTAAAAAAAATHNNNDNSGGYKSSSSVVRDVATDARASSRQQQQQRHEKNEHDNECNTDGNDRRRTCAVGTRSKYNDISHATLITAATTADTIINNVGSSSAHMNTNALSAHNQPAKSNDDDDDDKNQHTAPPSLLSSSSLPPHMTHSSLSSFNAITNNNNNNIVVIDSTGNDLFPVSHVQQHSCRKTPTAERVEVVPFQSHYHHRQQPHNQHLPPYQSQKQSAETSYLATTDKNSAANDQFSSQQQPELNSNESQQNKRRSSSSLFHSYLTSAAAACCNNKSVIQLPTAVEQSHKTLTTTTTESFANRLLLTGGKRATSILNFLSTHTAAAASNALSTSSTNISATKQQQNFTGTAGNPQVNLKQTITPVYNRTSSTSNVLNNSNTVENQQPHRSFASNLSSTPSSPATASRRPRTASSANAAAVGNICRRAVESVTEKLFAAYLNQHQHQNQPQVGSSTNVEERNDVKRSSTSDTSPAASLPMHTNATSNGATVLVSSSNNYHNSSLNYDYVRTNLGMSTSPNKPPEAVAVATTTERSGEAPARSPVEAKTNAAYSQKTIQQVSSTYHGTNTSSSSSLSSQTAIRPTLLNSAGTTGVESQPSVSSQLSFSASHLYYPCSSGQINAALSAPGPTVCNHINTVGPMITSTLTARHANVVQAPSPAASNRMLPISPNNSVDRPQIIRQESTQQQPNKHGRTDSYEEDDDTGDGFSHHSDRKSKHYSIETSTILTSLGTSISALMTTTSASSSNPSTSASGEAAGDRRHQHFLTISAFPSPPSSKVPSQSDFYQTMQSTTTIQALQMPSSSDAPLHLSSSVSCNDSFRTSLYQSRADEQQQLPLTAVSVETPAGVLILPNINNLPVITRDTQFDNQADDVIRGVAGLSGDVNPISERLTSSSSSSDISATASTGKLLSFSSQHRAVAATLSTPVLVVGGIEDALTEEFPPPNNQLQALHATVTAVGPTSSSINNLRLLGIGTAGTSLGPPGSTSSGALSPKLASARGSLNVAASSSNAAKLTVSPTSSPASRRRASAIAQNMMVLQASGAALVRSKLLASAVAGQTVSINSQQQMLHNYKPTSAMTDAGSMPTAKTVAASSTAAAKLVADEEAAALQRPKPLPIAVSATRAMSSASSQMPVVKSNSIDVTRRGMRYALHHQSFVKHGDDAARAAVVARDARDRAKDQEQKIPHLKALQASGDDTYRQLGTYKVGNATLGHGTYSIVKLAYNEEDHSHYAMKILSKKKLTKKFRMQRKVTGDPLQDVRREIAILRKVNHPNIIKLIEVLDDPSEDYLYLVFELLEREVIEVPTQNPLSEDEAWAYFREVVRGVEYLHHYRIVHRDLKPSNLLLSESGELKIADFGVSDEFEGVDASFSGTVGTPAFTAPECLNPAIKTYSGRAIDIWCMGITLYCFVVGDVPFKDDFLLMLYNKIRHNQPEFPETLSENLKDLILRMLEKNPEQRITLEQIKNHQWVTKGDLFPMLTEDENCNPAIHITKHDIETSVKTIPSLSTLILVKHMIKRASFSHPFRSASTCT